MSETLRWTWPMSTRGSMLTRADDSDPPPCCLALAGREHRSLPPCTHSRYGPHGVDAFSAPSASRPRPMKSALILADMAHPLSADEKPGGRGYPNGVAICCQATVTV